MQSTHSNFKVKQSGLIINEKMQLLHATPDFCMNVTVVVWAVEKQSACVLITMTLKIMF